MTHFNRTLEFLLNIGLSLIISSLFSLIMVGGYYVPITKNSDWSKIEQKIVIARSVHSSVEPEGLKAADLASFLQEAQTIGFWERYTLIDKFLLVAVTLTLIRLLHSFFLLYRDEHYHSLINSATGRAALNVVQLFTQASVVIGCLFAISRLTPGEKILPIWGISLIFALMMWDYPVVRHLRKCTISVNNKRQQLLLKTFNNWLTIEKFSLIILMVVSLLWIIAVAVGKVSGSENNAQMYLEFCAALFLTLFLISDYVINHEFYFGLKSEAAIVSVSTSES